MSFFINIRNSVTTNRKSSHKNDSSVVKINASRSKSVVNCYRSKNNNRNNNKNLNNIESLQSSDHQNKSNEEDTRSIGSLMRSETFTIEDHRKNESVKSNRKNSLKDTMFEKFTTFTRRKKSSPAPEEPSKPPVIENLNTYKSWPTPSDNIEVTHQSEIENKDPFNCLYDKRSSIKSDRSSSERGSIIDCGTYKKNKLPSDIKERLDELKSHPERLDENEHYYDEGNENDKYKTVTLNSFRKSFREKFLAQQQQSPAYNPSWFVEVDPPPPPPPPSKYDKDNENYVRPDILVFDNDNYRTTARSPVRNDNSPVRRSASRPNLQRQETFKVERQEDEQPSIRIEIKNSITPNEPGRIVPVGVAKPIQSFNNNENKNWSQQPQYQNYPSQQNKTSGYQTRIQIKQDTKYPLTTSNNYSGQRQSRPSQRQTSRIQITSSSPSPSGVQKYNNGNSNGYLTNRYISNNYSPLSSYDIIKNNSINNIPNYGYAKTNNPTPTQNRSQCYFGDNLLRQQNYNSQSQTVDSGTGVINNNNTAAVGGGAGDIGRKKWNKPATIQQQVYQQQREQIQQQLQQPHRKQWIKPTVPVQNQQYHQDLQKPIYLQQKPKTGFTGYLSNKWNGKETNRCNTGIFTTTSTGNQQNRRSRSPIKVPWR